MARLASLFVLLCVFWLLLSGLYYAWLLIVGLLVVPVVVFYSYVAIFRVFGRAYGKTSPTVRSTVSTGARSI